MTRFPSVFVSFGDRVISEFAHDRRLVPPTATPGCAVRPPSKRCRGSHPVELLEGPGRRPVRRARPRSLGEPRRPIAPRRPRSVDLALALLAADETFVHGTNLVELSVSARWLEETRPCQSGQLARPRHAGEMTAKSSPFEPTGCAPRPRSQRRPLGFLRKRTGRCKNRRVRIRARVATAALGVLVRAPA